jgi:serine/threonine protein kinase
VAVKTYREENCRAKSHVDMFCREVQMLNMLDHPNVIKFVGACVETPFAIITELVTGGQ